MAQRLGVVAPTLLIGVLVGGSAPGYVRSLSPKSGKPFTWLESCIVIEPDARGSQDLTLDDIDATLARSVDNWASRTNACSNLRLTSAPATRQLEVAPDGQPVVVFRDQVWARPGQLPHDPAAIGLTTVFHVSTPGLPGDATILDTDIELNGVNFTFTTDPDRAQARPGTQLADLENTLTHELGHVQGLAHTCWDHVQAEAPLDENGDPIPDCNGVVPQEVQDTTMYPYSQSAGETTKRSLSDDEVNGICGIYPSTDPPKACYQRVTGGGFDCAFDGGGRGVRARARLVAATVPVGAVLLTCGAGVALRTRRRRRRR